MADVIAGDRLPVEAIGRDPVVSVIVIFLDAARYLEEAAASVFAQTLTDWELLLIDDGSTDGSTSLARDMAKRHAGRVRYFEHSGHVNRGMSASRNLGLAQAHGRYVAFLDADDVYLPERLEEHVRILEQQHDIDMVQSDLVHWYSWAPETERVDEDYVRPFFRSGDWVLVPPDGLLLALEVPLSSPGICSITVRRQVALAVGGFDDGFRHMYEDQVFLAKVYLSGRVYVRQAYLARYRRHPGSWSRRLKEGRLGKRVSQEADRSAFHAWVAAYVRRQEVKDERVVRFLRPLVPDNGTTGTRSSGLGVGSLLAQIRLCLSRSLPRSSYRRLLRCNREREFRAARRQFDRIAKTFRAVEAQENHGR